MRRKRLRGATLVEVTFAAALSTIVLFGAINTFLSGSVAWVRGQGKIDAETGSQRAVRQVSRELREAMSVIVDADGQGLTYRLPTKLGDGSYSMPVTWDGVARRIYLASGSLYVSRESVTKRLCNGIITTDPQSSGGSAPYKIFNAGAGTITRSLNVMVVSRQNTDRTSTATSRSRETIYLRNIPQLVK